MAENDFSINDAPTLRPVSAAGGRHLVAGDTILGRYAVVRELGEGGMGVVYQCLDTVGGVEVAVKGLPPEVSRNEDEMEDIRANYQIVRKLRHPNIAGVATLEKDAAAGDYYLVMDLAAGVTLKRWARRHPDAGLDVKLAILRQVAAALDYAHAEKVIHRDVKPENVMVDDDGRVKVLDFGLAAQIRSSQSRTSNTVTSKGGTPGYKSPEQWLGRPQQAPADVYSFGVMAYWLFSGHLPFDGDDPVVLGHAVLSAPVEPIPNLPTHMNVALVKALAKEPDERFTSCGAFMDALEERAWGRVEHVERVDDAGGARSRATAKIIIAAAAFALAAVGGWWYVNSRAARSTGITGVPPVATNTPAGTTSVSPVATRAPTETTGILPVATNTPTATGVSPVARSGKSVVPTTVSLPGSGTPAASLATNKLENPTPQPTWEETQRAVNDAKRHVVFIRRRVESVIEETIKPYRAHGKYFGEILAEIDRQYEGLKNLKDPATIAEAQRFTTDAENAADEIENKGVRELEKRLKFCVSEEIRSAKEFFGKSERGEGNYWNEAIAAASRALALEPSNDDAKTLKKDAESHLVPTMQVVAKIDGREISGAKVQAGDESFTTPVVWKLKKGSRYGPYAVSYESDGKRYSGTIDSVTVDWCGQRPVSVELKEHTGPKDGECKAFTLPGGVRMEMVYVAPGSFQMGSSSGKEDEKPHLVRLTKGYWIGKYPVTQAQWYALVSSMGVSFEAGCPTAYHSRGGKGNNFVIGMDTSDFPMESISWNDCKVLVYALNGTECEGRHWSLPTEAQWEFAARGGNKSRGYTYSGSNDPDAVGWYCGNSGLRRFSDGQNRFPDGQNINLTSNKCRSHSVREKDVGNELGIVGMSGNVCEWCHDWYDKEYYATSSADDPQGPVSGVCRVLRGGNYLGLAKYCRSAARDNSRPYTRGIWFGLRLCCSEGPRE